jgi:hypothetical protein
MKNRKMLFISITLLSILVSVVTGLVMLSFSHMFINYRLSQQDEIKSIIDVNGIVGYLEKDGMANKKDKSDKLLTVEEEEEYNQNSFVEITIPQNEKFEFELNKFVLSLQNDDEFLSRIIKDKQLSKNENYFLIKHSGARVKAEICTQMLSMKNCYIELKDNKLATFYRLKARVFGDITSESGLILEPHSDDVHAIYAVADQVGEVVGRVPLDFSSN